MSAVENRGPQLQGAACALLAIAFVSILLRCYCRLFIVKRFGGDDYMMLLAMVFFTLFVTCALVGVHYGTGRHAVHLKLEDISQALKYWWFCYLWYCVTMICAKISIGYFLLVLVPDKTRKTIIYIALTLTGLCGTVFFFVTVFQCSPVSYFWNKDQPGSCLNIWVIEAITYLYSALSIISDFIFAILPSFLVWNLQMDTKSKILLIPILSMGWIASIAVIVRLPYVHNFSDPDFLYSTVDIAIWSTTEQGLCITAGSLATLRPLVRNVRDLFLAQMGSKNVALPSSDIVNTGGSAKRKADDRRKDSTKLEAIVPRGANHSSQRKPFWSPHELRSESEEELHHEDQIK